jgi:hypothetical protein
VNHRSLLFQFLWTIRHSRRMHLLRLHLKDWGGPLALGAAAALAFVLVPHLRGAEQTTQRVASPSLQTVLERPVRAVPTATATATATPTVAAKPKPRKAERRPAAPKHKKRRAWVRTYTAPKPQPTVAPAPRATPVPTAVWRPPPPATPKPKPPAPARKKPGTCQKVICW